MTMYRRLTSNHALDFALYLSGKYKKELIVFEPLRSDYDHSSERLHKFIIEGMCDNCESAEKIGISYWPYIETPDQPAAGLMKRLSSDACAIVTDDYPCFIIPEQISAISGKVDCRMIAVDSNCFIPLSLYGSFASAARILRPRIHKEFSNAFLFQARKKILKKDLISVNQPAKPPFTLFGGTLEEIEHILKKVRFRKNIKPAPGIRGGSKEAKKIFSAFVSKKLKGYSDKRNNPAPPEITPVSGMSPYLHFGHISVEEIVPEVLNFDSKKGWSPDDLNESFRGKNEGFFHKNPSVNSFLDEILTWRDIGYLMFWEKKESGKDLAILPDWLKRNNEKHRKDKRDYLYSQEVLEEGKTHDEVWNSAQKELIHTGRIHNYMRMLWGKKVIEWTRDVEEAFRILEELNNKYAYDGRDPNSYTGILWCFGLFDRPWFPERNIFGSIRYMSSDSTKKKFKIADYLDYVADISGEKKSLF